MELVVLKVSRMTVFGRRHYCMKLRGIEGYPGIVHTSITQAFKGNFSIAKIDCSSFKNGCSLFCTVLQEPGVYHHASSRLFHTPSPILAQEGFDLMSLDRTRSRAVYVAFLRVRSVTFIAYMCIGASERILDHFLSRSSAPTIPIDVRYCQKRCAHADDVLDNRVPMGSPFLLMRTQALSSNRIRPPSFLCCSFLALTTTACRISPRRTLFAMLKLDPPGFSGPKDLCFCTTTIILSPKGWTGVNEDSWRPSTSPDRALPIRACCVFFLIT